MKLKALVVFDQEDNLDQDALSGVEEDFSLSFIQFPPERPDSIKDFKPDLFLLLINRSTAALTLKKFVNELRLENPRTPCLILSDNQKILASFKKADIRHCEVVSRRETLAETLRTMALRMASVQDKDKKKKSSGKTQEGKSVKNRISVDSKGSGSNNSIVDMPFEYLMNNFPGYILEVDNDGRIVLANRIAPGLQKDKVIGSSVLNYVHEKDHEILKAFLDQYPKKRKTAYFELKGNELIGGMWMSVKVIPLNRPPKTDRMLVIIDDISEMKTWENELKKRLEYENLIASCLKILTDGVKLDKVFKEIAGMLRNSLNLSRVYIYENREDNKDRFAVQIEEAVAPEVKSLMNSPRFSRIRYNDMPAGIMKRLTSNKSYWEIRRDSNESEKKLFNSRGVLSILYVPISVRNKFWGFIGFDDCREERNWKKPDISLLKTIADMIGQSIDRNLSTEALYKSEQKYRAVAETAVAGIGIVDENETFTWVNKAFADMLGRKVDELIGTSLKEISDPSEFRKYIQETASKRLGKSHSYESRLYRKDRSGVDIFVHSSPLTNADGSFEGTLAVVIDITAAKKAMEQLKKSEKKYKDLILTLNEGILVINKNSEVIFANSAMTDMLDYDMEEMLGRNIADFVEKDYHLGIKKMFSLQKNNKARSFEIELRNKYGEKIYTYFSISKIEQDDDGDPALLAGVIDITSLKTAENELKRLDFQLQERVKELNGLYKLEELNQRSNDLPELFNEFVNEIAPDSLGFKEEAIIGVKIGRNEYKNSSYAGLKYSVSHPIKVNRCERGTLLVGYSSGLLAISENEKRLIRQYAERLGTIIESRENQEALGIRSRAIETSASAFAFADMKGRFAYVNPSFVDLWGYDSADEIVGTRVLHYFQPGLPFSKMFDQLRRDDYWIGELTARKKDETFFTVHVSANFQRDKDGTPVSMMLSFMDISELKKLQEKLIQSERLAATGELVASIAHEINSPLQAITFLLVSLGKKCQEDSVVKNDIDLLTNAFGRIRDTVKDLLDLNRPGREKKQLMNINRLIVETANLSSSYLRGKKIEINCTLLPDIPDIVASPKYLSQVFLNLINNSVEAITGDIGWKRKGLGTPVSGEIEIKSIIQKGMIVVTFEDNGPGIPQEDLKYIFDPFFTKKKKMGVGVGLSVCYNIIKEHKGTIEAENKPDGGAKFTIKLPLDYQI